MAKVPGKFDDIVKTAKSVLDDDFNCKDQVIKTKTKGGFGDMAAETTVTFSGEGDATPAKLSFKIPKPFQLLDGFAVDKFEISSDGKTKAEFGFDGKTFFEQENLKFTVAASASVSDCSGLVNLKESTMKVALTGIDSGKANITVSAKPSAPGTSLAVEGIRSWSLIPNGVVGMSWNEKTAISCPTTAISCKLNNDLFLAGVFKEQFSAGTAYVSYKATDDINVAAMADFKSTTVSKVAAAIPLKVTSDVTAKVKFEQTLGEKSQSALSVALKAILAPGTTLQGGVQIDLASPQTPKFGANLNIE